MPITKRKSDDPDAPMGVGEDVLRSGGSGLARGVVGLPGMPGDVLGLMQRGIEGGVRQFTGETREQMDARIKAMGGSRPEDLWGSEQAIAGASAAVPAVAPALNYQPQTTPGQIAQVTGEFVGGALPTAGVGAWMKAGTRAEKMAALAKELLAQGVAPGVASETAGQVADRYAGEDWGTAVRIATGIATGVAGGVAHNVTGPPGATTVPGVAGTVRSTAAGKIGESIRDAGGAGAVDQQLNEVGQGGRLADATPGLRGQTEQLYIQPGSSQQTVRGFLNDRVASLRGSQDTALTRALDDVINPRSANFAEEANQMRDARRARANQLYGDAERMVGDQPIPLDRARAYVNSRIPDDVLNGVTPPLPEHTEMQQLARFLEGDRNMHETTQIRDILQSRIDKEIRAGGAPDDLIAIKDQVNSALERATQRPDGTSVYGDARRAYREDSGILEEVQSGRDFFKGKETPDEFALRWRDMTDAERQGFRLGLREALGGKMDMAVNDFNAGSNALATQANQSKLRTALGDAPTERLTQRLEGLRRQRGTVQGIQNQSATAGRLRGRSTIMDPEKVADTPPLSRVQSLTGMASLAGETLLEKALGRRQRGRADVSNADQARILTQDLDNLPPGERLAMLRRLEEVYDQQGSRQLPANRLLLALQAAYQSERSDDNSTQRRGRP